MKLFRSFWVVLNLLIATIICGTIVILIGPFDHQKKTIGPIARFWARWVVKSTGIRTKVSGLENLNKGQRYIFAGNHESALDIPVAIASLPINPVFLAKKELFNIPIFGWALMAAGMIRVDRQNRDRAKKSVDQAVAVLHSREVSVIIYPEGTRSLDKNLLPFKKGGFLLAIRAGLPVVPITILGAQNRVSKKSFTINPGEIEFIVDKPIPTSNMDDSDRDNLLTQVRQVIQLRKNEYFQSAFSG